jgi:hypothetical protein
MSPKLTLPLTSAELRSEDSAPLHMLSVCTAHLMSLNLMGLIEFGEYSNFEVSRYVVLFILQLLPLMYPTRQFVRKNPESKILFYNDEKNPWAYKTRVTTVDFMYFGLYVLYRR